MKCFPQRQFPIREREESSSGVPLCAPLPKDDCQSRSWGFILCRICAKSLCEGVWGSSLENLAKKRWLI